MVKHPACAAASSSSGLVPMPSSNRVLKEYAVALSTPLWVLSVPAPSCNPPCHSAVAVLFIQLSPCLHHLRFMIGRDEAPVNFCPFSAADNGPGPPCGRDFPSRRTSPPSRKHPPRV